MDFKTLRKTFYKKVTKNFHVDSKEQVYDDMGCYYAPWKSLSIEEQNLVSSNKKSVLPVSYCSQFLAL